MAEEPDNIDEAQRQQERAFAAVFRTGLSVAQVEFLECYLTTGSINRAAKLSGIDRKRHYEWMKDANYVVAFREAQKQTAVALEEEARRRAVDGVLEPVFGAVGGGTSGLIGYRRRFSDTLLVKLLEANNPEKFVKGQMKPDTDGVNIVVHLPDNGRDSARSSAE